jgi:hypothetical protein
LLLACESCVSVETSGETKVLKKFHGR